MPEEMAPVDAKKLCEDLAIQTSKYAAYLETLSTGPTRTGAKAALKGLECA
jgi:hypothetical protein